LREHRRKCRHVPAQTHARTDAGTVSPPQCEWRGGSDCTPGGGEVLPVVEASLRFGEGFPVAGGGGAGGGSVARELGGQSAAGGLTSDEDGPTILVRDRVRDLLPARLPFNCLASTMAKLAHMPAAACARSRYCGATSSSS
jgi:hypothetical protein